MTDADTALSTFKRFVEENPYTGTTEQVVTLAMGIAAAGKRLSRPTFSLYRDESGIGEKVFSKLKVIGNTLGELKETKRREVIKGLPASYSAIHLLCSLKAEDLATAVLKGHITPNSSVSNPDVRQTSPLPTAGSTGWGEGTLGQEGRNGLPHRPTSGCSSGRRSAGTAGERTTQGLCPISAYPSERRRPAQPL